MTEIVFRGKRRTWTHRSVAALMREAKNGEEPDDVIRRKAHEAIDEAVSLGWEGPPFDPKILASLRGVEVVASAQPLGSEARIFPTPGGVVRIEYDESFPKTRTSFSLCHELTHTFFPDCYEMVRNRNLRDPAEAKHKELEDLCDLGAGELLMPLPFFANDISSKAISLYALAALADRYAASLEATIIRGAKHSREDFGVVIMSEKFKPSEEREAQTRPLGFIGSEMRPKLRVDYANVTEGFSLFIPKNKSAPANSVAYKALSAEGIQEAKECWEIANFGLRTVQAVALPKVNGVNRVAVFVANAASTE